MSSFEEPLKGKPRYKTKLRTIRLPVALDSALEEEAGKRTIIAKHDLGPNWSVWLECYLGEAIRSNLGVTPRIESSPNTVKFEFQNSRSPSAGRRSSDSI